MAEIRSFRQELLVAIEAAVVRHISQPLVLESNILQFELVVQRVVVQPESGVGVESQRGTGNGNQDRGQEGRDRSRDRHRRRDSNLDSQSKDAYYEHRRLQRLLSSFKKLSPPEFRGGLDLEQAEYQVREMERLFYTLGCLEEERVRLAAHYLREVALRWWDGERRTFFRDRVEPIPWSEFIDRLFLKYMPRKMREGRKREFLKLRQGDLSIKQYEERFSQLFKYALEVIVVEEDQMRRFLNGLALPYQRAFCTHVFAIVSDIIQIALQPKSYYRTGSSSDKGKKTILQPSKFKKKGQQFQWCGDRFRVLG